MMKQDGEQVEEREIPGDDSTRTTTTTNTFFSWGLNRVRTIKVTGL